MREVYEDPLGKREYIITAINKQSFYLDGSLCMNYTNNKGQFVSPHREKEYAQR